MKKIVLLLIPILLLLSAEAQNNTFYFNTKIFHSTDLNPARQHSCKFSMGLPAITSVYTIVKNQGLSYNDVFTPITNKPDSFYFNLDNIYNKMPQISYFPVSAKISLGYIAFWIKDFYVNLSSNFNTNVNVAYPKSLFAIKDGLYFPDNRYFSISDLGAYANAYIDMGIGISKEIIPNLVVGVKLKRYYGIAMAQFNVNLDWKVSTADTNIYDYSFEKVSYDVRYAGPIHLTPQYDSSNIINNFNYTEPSDLTNFDNFDFNKGLNLLTKYTSSKGWGIDIGAVYTLFNKIELSASLLDLGYINWKSNPLHAYNKDFNFTFSGADPGKYLGDSTVFSMLGNKFQLKDTLIKDILDTLIPLVMPKMDSTSFKSFMNTSLIFGIAIKPTNWITVGFMYRGLFVNKKIVPQYALSGNIEFWRGWSLMMSYTFFNKSYNNIGLGFSAKLMPFQFFMIMDNVSVPSLALRYATSPNKTPDKGYATKWVKNTNMINIQFGFNFMIGCKNKLDYGLLD